MDLRGAYQRNLANNPARERGFLSAVSFTTTFAITRGITHAIRAGVGPFHNLSEGGTHVHHSTFGIFGLLGVGYLWTYRRAIGDPTQHHWHSRTSAIAYGAASALTLDEFALWLDLEDDYWNQRGRKSIDAVALFAGLLTAGSLGRGVLKELDLLPAIIRRHV